MKKLLVLPGATDKFMERIAGQIDSMGKDGTLILGNDIKIYNIDDAVIWSKQEVEEFLDTNGIQWRQEAS